MVCTLLHRTKTVVSVLNDREEEKAHIKQALCWTGYQSWLVEGVDMLPPDQPVANEVEEDPPDIASDERGPSTPTETTAD